MPKSGDVRKAPDGVVYIVSGYGYAPRIYRDGVDLYGERYPQHEWTEEAMDADELLYNVFERGSGCPVWKKHIEDAWSRPLVRAPLGRAEPEGGD